MMQPIISTQRTSSDLRFPNPPVDAETQRLLEELKTTTKDFSKDDFDTRQNAEEKAIALVTKLGSRAVPLLANGVISQDPEVAYRFASVIRKTGVFKDAFKEKLSEASQVTAAIFDVFLGMIHYSETTTADEILKDVANAAKLTPRLSDDDCKILLWVADNVPGAMNHISAQNQHRLIMLITCSDTLGRTPLKDTLPGKMAGFGLVRLLGVDGKKEVTPVSRKQAADLLVGLAESHPEVCRVSENDLLRCGLEKYSLQNDPRVRAAWKKAGLDPDAKSKPQK